MRRRTFLTRLKDFGGGAVNVVGGAFRSMEEPMLLLSFLAGVLSGFLVALLALRLTAFRGAARVPPLELIPMAQRLGVELDLQRVAAIPEGDRLWSALVRCKDCASLDRCRVYLGSKADNGVSPLLFCPNAAYLLGLASRQNWRMEQMAGA